MADTLSQRGDLFFVVRNEEGRQSIWPTRKELPGGWRSIFGPVSRQRCHEFLVNPRGANPIGAALPDQDCTSEAERGVRLGLMFFGDQEFDQARNKYDLLIECAKTADREGLTAIWLPERHFTEFGCLFPSPSVLHAAIARETTQIRLRAGSVVLPLHHPVRVVEEWSVVDNLSNGRVDLAFASGWHPNDFAMWPNRYENRKEEMFRGIETIQQLWRGEPIALDNGVGESIDVRVFPTPRQLEVPIWLTAATSPETFRRAGALGLNVLTHLFDQEVEELAKRIALYREARHEHGWNRDQGIITVTLHTFIADSQAAVRRHAKQPYCAYLKANMSLLKNLALSRGVDADLDGLDDRQLDELLDYMFEKFLSGRSLLGTPETCRQLLDSLASIGVQEVACLVDFGVSPESILSHLPHILSLQHGDG